MRKSRSSLVQIDGNDGSSVETQIRIRVDDVEERINGISGYARRQEDPIGRGGNTALAETAPATNRHHEKQENRGSGKNGRPLHEDSLSDARFRYLRALW